jgi:hypothetical protein
MVIAKRILKLSRPNGVIDVPVVISAPEQETPKSWKCEFEISFPENVKRQAGWGVDSTQALIQCLWMIGLTLYTSEHHAAGNLYWEKPGDGYGFPVIGPSRDVLIGSDAKYF